METQQYTGTERRRTDPVLVQILGELQLLRSMRVDFAVLKSEHDKRSQNCPMLLAIQNGREARIAGLVTNVDMDSLRDDIGKKMDVLKDGFSKNTAQIAGIVGGVTIIQIVVFWLLQRGG